MLREILESAKGTKTKLMIGNISKEDIDWYKNITTEDLESAFENLIDEIYKKYPKFKDPKYGLPGIMILDYDLDWDTNYKAWYILTIKVEDIFNYDGDDRPATSKEEKEVAKWIEKNVEVDSVDCGYGSCSVELEFNKPIYFNF